jgi:DNA-binding transcriptional LysR family regulator
MDRFESMSTLIATVEAGSFSGASRRLRMPLATVSRKVSELEAHLGTRLLQRSTRKLALTDAGRAYVAVCKRVLEQLEEADRAATGEYTAPKGDLVVAAPIVLGRMHVVPVVAEFLRAYPGIDVRLVLSDRVTNLLEERVDVAIRVGELADSSLMAVRVGQIERVICGSPAYFARRGTPKKPAQLAEHDCVTFEGIASPTAWSFITRKAKVSVRVRSRLVVNTAEAAIDAAVAGVGITRVLSYQIAAAESAGTLVRVLRSFESNPVPVHLVYTGQPLLPLKLRAFLDFAAQSLKSRITPAAN